MHHIPELKADIAEGREQTCSSVPPFLTASSLSNLPFYPCSALPYLSLSENREILGMGTARALKADGLTDEDVQLKLVYLLGVWLEALLYGRCAVLREKDQTKVIHTNRDLSVSLLRGSALLLEKQEIEHLFPYQRIHW